MKTIKVRNSSLQFNTITELFASMFFFKASGVSIALLTALISVIIISSGCTSRQNGPSDVTPVASNPPSTALPMPPLNVKSLSNMGWELADGRHNIFSDFKGSAVVLDFYATWCEPCRASVPHLIELQKKYADQGLKVIGLNVGGPDDLAKVDGFAKEFNIDYPLAVPDNDLVHFLLADTSDIPQTFVFDRQGLLARRFVGFGPSTPEQMESAIQAALRPLTP